MKDNKYQRKKHRNLPKHKDLYLKAGRQNKLLNHGDVQSQTSSLSSLWSESRERGKLLFMEGVILGESLSKQHAVLRSGSKTNKPTEPFTSVAALQPKGVILKPKRLAKYQHRANPHFIGSTNFEPGKSAFAYYRL